MSKDDLLSKCLHGRTQNANEAFNHIIWKKCPKSVYVGRSTLELGVSAAVLGYNEGAEGVFSVLDKLGIKGGKNTALICECRTRKQQINMTVKKSLVTKQQRKRLRAKRKGFFDAEKEAEGGDSYSSGAF